MSPWSCMCSVFTVHHWLLLTLSPYSTGLLILLKGPLTWCQMRCLSTCRNTALEHRSLRMNFLTRTMTRTKTILSLWWNQSEAAQCRRCMQTVITFQKGGQRTALWLLCKLPDWLRVNTVEAGLRTALCSGFQGNITNCRQNSVVRSVIKNGKVLFQRMCTKAIPLLF